MTTNDIQEQDLTTLLEKYTICFPAVQREYIHGSNNETIKNLRDKLVKEILKVLKSEDNTYKNLNIIYGYSNNDIFYPIDGQQRITTLYILYLFLALKARKYDSIVFKKALSYEVKLSSKDFFKTLCKEKNKNDLIEIIDGDNFLFDIVAKSWFKSSWLKDSTVLSVLNVINELLKTYKLSDKEYKKCYDNFNKIKFYFICKEIPSAKDESITSYIKLNSRGRQLSDFDNIKSLLHIIEQLISKDSTFDKSFAYQYDSKYVDIFFNQQDKNLVLDELTNEINKHSINFLINTLNVVMYLNDANYTEVKTVGEYIDNLNKFISDFNSNELIIREYFKLIKNILNFIYNNQNRVILIGLTNLINSIKSKYELCNDAENYIAKILYINTLIHKEKKVFEDIEREATILNYTLLNLNYNSWGNKLNCVNNLINKICEYDGVIDFFVCENNKDICNLINNKKINNRVNEQVIKYKIIKYNNLEYNYFETLENEFSEYRSVYFLLYFINAYNFQTKKEFNDCLGLLEKYKNIGKSLYKRGNKELKSKFAITTYYSLDGNSLPSEEIINKKANYRYIVGKQQDGSSILDIDTLHYWTDDYYFIDKTKKEIQDTKLNTLKLLYDLILGNKINTLNQMLNGENYDNCWLKYAIEYYNDKNDTCLLDKKLCFNNNKVYLQTDYNNYNINFFAYYHYLLNYTPYSEKYIYDISTRNIRDTLKYNYNHILYKKNSMKKQYCFIPEYITWQSEDIVYKSDRRFYYNFFKLKVPINNDSIFFIEKNIITIYEFTYSKYTEKTIDISGYADKYEKLLVKNRTMVLSFPNKKDDEFEKLENENFDICKSYKYNNEYIIKLKSKDSEVITLDI